MFYAERDCDSVALATQTAAFPVKYLIHKTAREFVLACPFGN